MTPFQQYRSGKTLRELATGSAGIANTVPLVGTPGTVAVRMGEIMEEVGGDGFLLTTNGQTASRRQIIEICDGLVPALQRRGLARTHYPDGYLRDRLRAF